MIEVANEGETRFVAGLALSGDKLIKRLEIYLKNVKGGVGLWSNVLLRRIVMATKRTGIAKDEQTRLEPFIEKVEISFRISGEASGCLVLEYD